MIENRLRKVHRVKQSLVEGEKYAETVSSLLERTIRYVKRRNIKIMTTIGKKYCSI
jgi:hypothetical protein